jgi:GntR family transcriptional regulator
MYKQVTDQIKNAIAGGDLCGNEKLPSVRELSKALNISSITIKRAYLDLEKEGYIFTRPGLGSYVADINRENLRKEKLDEIQKELTKMLKSGMKFNISADDVIGLINDIKGDLK